MTDTRRLIVVEIRAVEQTTGALFSDMKTIERTWGQIFRAFNAEHDGLWIDSMISHMRDQMSNAFPPPEETPDGAH